MSTDLNQLCINTIRMLAADGVEKAKSGHPGMPMGAAAMAYVLWTRFLRHNPKNPGWPDRDRFVLSAGHGSMLLYSLLHLSGYDLSLEDLQNFRQWGSKTPGHPEHGLTPGVETTTGPLGQGFANGVGMALAERYLAARFNRPGHHIVDHFTYGIVSDGDLMEGISHEAASLAGHLGLGKLIYFYDDNHISIEGDTDIAFTENRTGRFVAYGWHVQRVDDGNDLEALEQAIVAAQKESKRPSLIAVRTHIGYGSPSKQDTAGVHGEPLGPEEIKLTKDNLKWPREPSFLVPDEVSAHFRQAIDEGQKLETRWQAAFEAYRENFETPAAEWDRWMSGRFANGWQNDIPVFEPDDKGLATRVASGKVLNAVAPKIAYLIGGSADLAPSTKTLLSDEADYQAANYAGRNLRFGVREHAMGAVLNGMGLIKVRGFGSQFLIFSDYTRATLRLSALMEIPVINIYTHDSIGVGEDGPTHQPIEHLASMRAIPGFIVLRPADANEVVEAWKVIMKLHHEPAALILTRQAVPTFDRSKYAPASGVAKGAYVLADATDGQPEVILIATGSEVVLCVQAYEQLKTEGIKARVVSMPSWEIFDDYCQKDPAYRESILPSSVTARVSVELASTFGWERYVGTSGAIIGMKTFGASAPLKELTKKFGFTLDNVVDTAKEQIRNNEGS